MSIIKKQLLEALKFKLDQATLNSLMQKSMLDDQFVVLSTLQKTLLKLEISFRSTNHQWHDLIKSAQNNIDKQQQCLLLFYERCFDKQDTIGDFDLSTSPDIIVVLGCNQPMMKKRAKGAIKIIKKFTKIPVVLSGGGFNLIKTEAQQMYDIFKKADIDETRLILEADSMDTIGNALFSKLQLKHLKRLKKSAKLLIITSQFHAHRSLDLFHYVFGEAHKIAVYGVKTLTDSKTKLQIAQHELSTENNANLTIFNSTFSPVFKPKNISYLDETTLLIQLFLKHDLYKGRANLLRKWLPEMSTQILKVCS